MRRAIKLALNIATRQKVIYFHNSILFNIYKDRKIFIASVRVWSTESDIFLAQGEIPPSAAIKPNASPSYWCLTSALRCFQRFLVITNYVIPIGPGRRRAEAPPGVSLAVHALVSSTVIFAFIKEAKVVIRKVLDDLHIFLL